MDNNFPPRSSVLDEGSREQAELVDLSDGIFKNCMAESNIADLNTAIYLLGHAGHIWLDKSLRSSECLDLLVTGLATLVNGKISGLPACFVFGCFRVAYLNIPYNRLSMRYTAEDISEMDDSPSDMMSLASSIIAGFRQTVALSDLNTVILLYQEALLAKPSAGAENPRIIRQLANAHLIQFRFTGFRAVWNRNVLDIDMAVSVLRGADIQLSWGHSRQVALKSSLASALHQRFKARVESGDFDSAIELHYELLGLESEAGRDYSASRHSLATLLYERYERRGERSDLDAAIKLLYEAVRLRPAPHPNRGTSLTNLAGAITVRFQTRGELVDLEQAITLYQEALEFIPAVHPTRGSCLNNFAATLHERFAIRGDQVDLDGAIEMYHKALELVPVPHPHRSPAMTNLGNVLCTRFGTRGQPADIDNAIALYRNALELLPASHPHHSSTLYNLANALYDRFRISGEPAELDSAIGLQRKILDLRPVPHPDRSSSLNSLANLIQERFATRGESEDLDIPIRLLREAVDLKPAPHPDRGTSLDSLANALTSRFEIRGDPADLDSAIDLRREALILQPDFHAQSSWLDNLASGLSQRFHMRGGPTDLDSVIELHSKVLKLHPVPHPGCGDSLSNLASTLSDRFETRGEPKDLDSAVDLYHEALYLRPAPHPSHAHHLHNLATALQVRFKTRGDAEDIENAFGYHSKALHLRPAHPDRGISLNGLGNVYRQRFQKWGSPEDINNAVKLYREVLDIFPPSHIHYGLALSNTALGSIESYDKTLDSYNMEEAIITFRRAASHTSSVSHRFKMSAIWARAADRRNHASALEAYETAIGLLPQLAMLGLNLDSRQRAMRLETNIGLAMHYNCMSLWMIFMLPIQSWQRGWLVCVSGDVQRMNLENVTRHGLELPVKIPRASLSGSEVQINQVMQDISTREASVELPDLQTRLLAKRENSDHYSPDEVLKDILEALWTLIVEPIFRALGLKKTENPGRLWWCLTGPFSFLPIHAAGLYDGGIEAHCVSDYVVSSYAPTLTSLLNPPTETVAPFKMTALIQPNTPECSPLPGTEEELTRIQDQVPEKWLHSLGRTSQATVEAALVHLRESSIVHFACHGIQDRKNPLDSGLLLTDGRLKVSELMRKNDNIKSQQKTMTLAFLSACETAKGDDKLPDEAMHLAATHLFAGFRGVVATMWTIADSDGPKIADAFYAHLFKGCNGNAEAPVLLDLTEAAEALHAAVAKLRADPSVSFKRWVPFVHYGL
ncbi:CHAT domain-containing protein [Mycena albidolilacea]|uniref:CHAT domain-containing protein n=1 Tax=Mycena albidolilacea TaxID=1033008 RepID=A0AAD7EN15_9AGAR|nr:CHAT domain-containing protein [Mycena albidolilacea]